MFLKKYCCFDPKTEALIVAIFHVVAAALSTFGHTIYLIDLDSVVDDKDKNTERYRAYEALFTSLVALVINGLLTYGVVKEKRFYLLPWLAFHGMGYAVLPIILFVMVFWMPWMIIALIFSIPLLHSWYCVYRYYRTLDPYQTTDPISSFQEQQPFSSTAKDIPVYIDVTKGPNEF